MLSRLSPYLASSIISLSVRTTAPSSWQGPWQWWFMVLASLVIMISLVANTVHYLLVSGPPLVVR